MRVLERPEFILKLAFRCGLDYDRIAAHSFASIVSFKHNPLRKFRIVLIFSLGHVPHGIGVRRAIHSHNTQKGPTVWRAEIIARKISVRERQSVFADFSETFRDARYLIDMESPTAILSGAGLIGVFFLRWWRRLRFPVGVLFGRN